MPEYASDPEEEFYDAAVGSEEDETDSEYDDERQQRGRRSCWVVDGLYLKLQNN